MKKNIPILKDLFSRKISFILSILVLVLLVGLPMCKTASPADEKQFTLSVVIGDGITGNPVDGSTLYSIGVSVNYSYQLESGYKNIIVTLDGAQAASEGTLIMDRDHSLDVTAEEGFDVTGNWDLELDVNDSGTGVSILEIISVSVEFSGMAGSGSVFINGQNVGSYSAQSEVVSFVYTITDPMLGQLKYDYTGEFTTNDTMGGDVIVYKISGAVNEAKSPEIEIQVKKGKWSGKRKKN